MKSICPRRIGAFVFLSTPKTSDHPHENENRTRPARVPCLCPSVHRVKRACLDAEPIGGKPRALVFDLRHFDAVTLREGSDGAASTQAERFFAVM